MPVRNRSLLKGILSIMSASVAKVIISTLFTPIVVRLLGTQEYGDYAYVMSILAIALIFANTGVAEGLRKYLSEDNHRESWQSDIFGFYFRVSIITSVCISTMILLLSTNEFFGYIDDSLVKYMQFVSIIVILKQGFNISRHSLMGLGYENLSEPLTVVEKLIFVIISILLAYYSFGVIGILTGYIISVLISSILGMWLLSDIINLKSIFNRRGEIPTKKLLTFNFSSVALSFLMISLYKVDVILLHTFVGSEQTAYYNAALVAAQFIWIVPKAVQRLLLHSTSNLWSSDKISRINNVAGRATKYTLLITLLMSIGLYTLSGDFVQLYFGKDYISAIKPMTLLLPGVIGFAVARPIFAVSQGSGNLRKLVIITAIVALLNLILNLMLIPVYGMVGAAVATSASYALMLLAHVRTARVIGFNPTDEIKIVRVSIATLTTYFIIETLHSFITYDILSLVLVPPIGLLVYLYSCMKLRVISHEEVNRLSTTLPSPVPEYVNWILRLI